jgi:hypothetical protein
MAQYTGGRLRKEAVGADHGVAAQALASVASRAREVPRPVRLWWAVAAIGFGVVLESLRLVHVDAQELTRDPDAVSGLGSDVGSLSMVGLSMWAATVAVLALTGTVVHTRRKRRYLLSTAVLLGWLLLDDAIMIHDNLLPSLGVPDGVTYLVYVGVAMAWLLTFRREIAESEVALLVVAACAFGLSMTADVLNRLPVFEDYVKLVGIATLLLYALRLCRAELRRSATGSA